MYVYECFTSTYAWVCLVLWKSEEGVGGPETGVMYGHEPVPRGHSEPNPGPLEELLLIAEPALQPLSFILGKEKMLPTVWYFLRRLTVCVTLDVECYSHLAEDIVNQ